MAAPGPSHTRRREEDTIRDSDSESTSVHTDSDIISVDSDSDSDDASQESVIDASKSCPGSATACQTIPGTVTFRPGSDTHKSVANGGKSRLGSDSSGESAGVYYLSTRNLGIGRDGNRDGGPRRASTFGVVASQKLRTPSNLDAQVGPSNLDAQARRAPSVLPAKRPQTESADAPSQKRPRATLQGPSRPLQRARIGPGTTPAARDLRSAAAVAREKRGPPPGSNEYQWLLERVLRQDEEMAVMRSSLHLLSTSTGSALAADPAASLINRGDPPTRRPRSMAAAADWINTLARSMESNAAHLNNRLETMGSQLQALQDIRAALEDMAWSAEANPGTAADVGDLRPKIQALKINKERLYQCADGICDTTSHIMSVAHELHGLADSVTKRADHPSVADPPANRSRPSSAEHARDTNSGVASREPGTGLGLFDCFQHERDLEDDPLELAAWGGRGRHGPASSPARLASGPLP